MDRTTTILVSRDLKDELDSFKEYDRETYAEVIKKLIRIVKEADESKLELSNETLKAIEEAREDIKKGRVYTSKQLSKELGL